MLVICEVGEYQPWNGFLRNFAKNWKGVHFTVNRHRSNKLSSKVTVYGSFQKLVPYC